MVQYFCLFDLRAWATCSEATYFGCLYACRCLRAATKFLHAVVAICGQSSCSVVPQLWPRSFSSASTRLLFCALLVSALLFSASLQVFTEVALSLSLCLSFSFCPCVCIGGLYNKPFISLSHCLYLSVCLSFSPSQSLCMDR